MRADGDNRSVPEGAKLPQTQPLLSVLGRWLVCGALAWGSGCGDSPVDSGAATGPLGLARQVTWPGGGQELSVKFVGENGEAEASIGDALTVTLDGEPVAENLVRVQPIQVEPFALALVIRPAESSSERQVQVDALHELIALRPAAESIGLFLWQDTMIQRVAFTRDRPRLAGALDALREIAPTNSALAADAAIEWADERVSQLGGRSPRGLRAIVVVGEPTRLQVPTRAVVVAGLEEANARLSAHAMDSYYQVNVCGGSPGARLAISPAGREDTLHTSWPKALPESEDEPCDVTAMGNGLRNYPEVLDLVFSSAERSVYDSRTAALSKEDFALSVVLDDAPAIEATAHLRGKGTLACERKSYTLDLKGAGRHLLPESRTDEFYLLSMCADDRYIEQYTANQLLRELGLFPLAFRYIEVHLDGENQGVYLLLEKPKEELVRDASLVHSVMRRRFETNPPLDYFEHKFDSGAFDASALYHSAASDLGAVEKHIDVEQYLRFLATMTALGNGDYIDEVWIRGSEQGDGLWFETMAWDNDDLFSECHYSGQFAFEDPNGLVYCAEAAIDHTLLADETMYARYAEVLSEVLTVHLPPARFSEAVAATEEAILPILARDGVSAALVRLVADNPEAAQPAEAQRDVREKLAALRDAYAARHALLLERLEAWKGASL